MQLRINEVAKLVNRYPGTLRAYERRGVIPKAQRDPITGWRIYSEKDIETIRRILTGEILETVNA